MLLLTCSVEMTGKARAPDEEKDSKSVHGSRVATQECVIREDVCTFQDRLKLVTLKYLQ